MRRHGALAMSVYSSGSRARKRPSTARLSTKDDGGGCDEFRDCWSSGGGYETTLLDPWGFGKPVDMPSLRSCFVLVDRCLNLLWLGDSVVLGKFVRYRG